MRVFLIGLRLLAIWVSWDRASSTDKDSWRDLLSKNAVTSSPVPMDKTSMVSRSEKPLCFMCFVPKRMGVFTLEVGLRLRESTLSLEAKRAERNSMKEGCCIIETMNRILWSKVVRKYKSVKSQ